MTSLVYSSHTLDILSPLKTSMPHALLLEGAIGTGLFTIASELAGKDVQAVIKPTDAKGEVDPESGSIKIAQIRELYVQTKGISTKKRFIILDDADTMGLPAQNAFLKLLEEPTPNTYFILTAHRPEKLLPTIISRVQRVHVGPISSGQTKQLITNLGITDVRKVSQLMYVADGLPAEISRLALNTKQFESKVTYMTDARMLLQGSMLEKIKVINTYHLKRFEALRLIDAAQTILRRSIDSKPTKDMIKRAEELADVHDRIKANGNIRLQLLSVVV